MMWGLVRDQITNCIPPKLPRQKRVLGDEHGQANLSNSKHILNPHADFSAGEDPIYSFGPLQKTLSMWLEAFSTPATTHLTIAALSIP